jgi:RimJ/RimL family protein N-acetyltransferase
MKSMTPTTAYYNQESERLLFRRFELNDSIAWTPFFINNPTQRFVGGHLFNLPPNEKALNWITKQLGRERDGQFGQLAVINKETNAFIGVGGIITREFENTLEYEITYSLLPAFWNKGYATELAIHFKNYAKEYIECDSVISIIHVENEASMNVARKNGMTVERETTFLNMPVKIFKVEF